MTRTRQATSALSFLLPRLCSLLRCVLWRRGLRGPGSWWPGHSKQQSRATEPGNRAGNRPQPFNRCLPHYKAHLEPMCRDAFLPSRPSRASRAGQYPGTNPRESTRHGHPHGTVTRALSGLYPVTTDQTLALDCSSGFQPRGGARPCGASPVPSEIRLSAAMPRTPPEVPTQKPGGPTERQGREKGWAFSEPSCSSCGEPAAPKPLVWRETFHVALKKLTLLPSGQGGARPLLSGHPRRTIAIRGTNPGVEVNTIVVVR